MSFVCNDDDVRAIRDHWVNLAALSTELLNQGEDVAVVFAEKLSQVFAALSPNALFRFRYCAAAGKVLVDLIVEIIAVGDDYKRPIARQLAQNLLREENHREAFPASLRVPEDTQAASSRTLSPSPSPMLRTLSPSPSPNGRGEIVHHVIRISLNALFPSPSPKGRREKGSNFFEHVFSVIGDSLIAEPQHPQSLRNHIGIAFLIVMPGLIWIVSRAIALDDQLRFVTVEVGDVVTKLMLPSELESK